MPPPILVTLPSEAELAEAIRASGQVYDSRVGRIRNAARVLEGEASVRFAEPNAIMRSQAESWTPNDYYFDDQWHLSSLDMEHIWADVGLGESGVKVAVLDSGVRWNNREWHFHTDFTDPWDFIDEDAEPDDLNGHGTHTAGIIGVRTNNHHGLASLAPGVSLMPLRVLDANGVGTLDVLIAALDWAIEHHASVLNMSLSFTPGFFPGATLEEKIADARRADIVLVASSGNDGVGLVAFPAAFNDVIAVGAMTKSGQVAPYSNWGAGLDLLAYGGMPEDADGDGQYDAILSIAFDPEDPMRRIGFWFAAGTSQAAPQVAALAALLRSKHQEYDADTVRSLILAGCDASEIAMQRTDCATGEARVFDESGDDEVKKRTSCWNDRWGYGRLDFGSPLNAPVTLGEGVEEQLGGYIPDYDAIPPYYPEGFFGSIVDTPEGLLLLMEDESGFYAFIDSGCDSREFEQEVIDNGVYESVCDVAQYLLPGWTLAELVGVEGGLLEFIARSGGLQNFVGRNGTFLGTTSNDGGLLGMITHNGGLLEMLAGNGGMLALIDANGSILEMIAGSGGLLGFLGGNGGLLGMLNGNGGLLGLMGNNGGLLGLMGNNGSIIGLTNVDGSPLHCNDRMTRRPLRVH
jgi:subtilisin family serine protease